MSDTIDGSKPSRESIEREFSQIISEVTKLAAESQVDLNIDHSDYPAPQESASGLSDDVERFSRLASELSGMLSNLVLNSKSAAQQLESLKAAADLKMKELEQLEEEQQLEKEKFENLIRSQRKLWEEEIARRDREERIRFENVRNERLREEEERKRQWAAEQMREKQKLEEEMRIIQQQNMERQQALERGWQERESALQNKELEWSRLIHELGQSLAKLSGRIHIQSAPQARNVNKEIYAPPPLSPPLPPVEQPAFADERSENLDWTARNESETVRVEKEPVSMPVSIREAAVSAPPSRDAVPIRESAREDRKPTLAEMLDPIFKDESQEESRPPISSLKEMLVSQGRRLENLNVELSAKRESTQSRFFSRKKAPKPKTDKLQ